MFFSRFTLPVAALAAFASTATAQTTSEGLTILVPGGDALWWGAYSALSAHRTSKGG